MDFDDIDDSNVDYSQSTNRNNQRDTFYNQPPMIQRPGQLEFQEIEEDDDSNTNEVRIDSTDEKKLEEFFEEEVKVEEETEEPLEIGGTPWKISFYRTFYNVDTKDVLLRISKTVNPFGINFFELIGNNADLYGWIWISITLTFAIAAMSNIVSYISDYLNDKADEWTYEFTKVTVGAVTIAIYVTVVPILAWIAYGLWLKIPLNIIQNLCIIGYSLFPYIPCAILMIVPINFVRWGIVLLTCIIVCIFLARNYFPYAKQRPIEGGVVLLFILLCNIILALILQLYFFDYSISMDFSSFSSPSPTPVPTPDVTPSLTPSITPSLSPSYSLSPTIFGVTPSITPSIPISPTLTDTPSISFSPSISISSLPSSLPPSPEEY